MSWEAPIKLEEKIINPNEHHVKRAWKRQT